MLIYKNEWWFDIRKYTHNLFKEKHRKYLVPLNIFFHKYFKKYFICTMSSNVDRKYTFFWYPIKSPIWRQTWPLFERGYDGETNVQPSKKGVGVWKICVCFNANIWIKAYFPFHFCWCNFYFSWFDGKILSSCQNWQKIGIYLQGQV